MALAFDWAFRAARAWQHCLLSPGHWCEQSNKNISNALNPARLRAWGSKAPEFLRHTDSMFPPDTEHCATWTFFPFSRTAGLEQSIVIGWLSVQRAARANSLTDRERGPGGCQSVTARTKSRCSVEFCASLDGTADHRLLLFSCFFIFLLLLLFFCHVTLGEAQLRRHLVGHKAEEVLKHCILLQWRRLVRAKQCMLQWFWTVVKHGMLQWRRLVRAKQCMLQWFWPVVKHCYS